MSQQQWGAQPPYGAYGQQQQPPYAPGNSQPYAQPYYPPSDVEQGAVPEKSANGGTRFKPENRLRDPVFLILFYLQFVGFCVVSGLAISFWVREAGLGGGVGSEQTGSSITLNSSTAYLLLLVTAAGLVLSTLYFILTRAFTHAIMHVTLLLTIALNIGICAYYWVTKYWSGAIIFTVIAILSILSYWGYRSRIPLASLILQVVMDVSKAHKSVFLVAFTTLFVQAGLSVWYTFSIIATYIRWTPGSPSCNNGANCSSSTVAGLIFYLTFSYIWTSMTINNVSLATLAGGPYGSWYYFGPRDAGLMPAHPTRQSFFRASTLSLGSIAFGSLIVTVLEVIRLVLNSLRNESVENGDPITAILACCAQCFVGIIEGLVEYFNRYAYIEIALYGKPYVAAAKDTWRMFKDRGIDALVNDSLVSMTLTWGAYLIGVLCSLFAYLYLRFTGPAYNADGQYTAPVLLFAFLIGAQLHLTLASAIEAGVSTIFVGLGEDPQVLATRAPALFAMIAERYPRVVQGVPRG